jgi:hypothetical protein
VKLNAGVVVAVATLVVNSGESDPALKLVTEALEVLHVVQAIAPVGLTVMGEVPLSPAEPMFAIGMSVGRLPTGTNPLDNWRQSFPDVPAVQLAGV